MAGKKPAPKKPNGDVPIKELLKGDKRPYKPNNPYKPKGKAC